MRTFIQLAVVIACPVLMCVIPMLSMRRKGRRDGCMQHGELTDDGELQRLRAEVATLRAELEHAKALR